MRRLVLSVVPAVVASVSLSGLTAGVPAAAITTTDPATVTVNCTTAAITGTTPAAVGDSQTSQGVWVQGINVEIQASVGDVLTITAQDCTGARNTWGLTVTPSMSTVGFGDITGQTPTYQVIVDHNFRNKPVEFESRFAPPNRPAFNGGELERRVFFVMFVPRTGPSPAPSTNEMSVPVQSVPNPWHLQQVPMPEAGTCDDLPDEHLSWGTGLTGGWAASWAQWPNGREGGYVCSRVLEWRPGNGWRLTH